MSSSKAQHTGDHYIETINDMMDTAVGMEDLTPLNIDELLNCEDLESSSFMQSS